MIAQKLIVGYSSRIITQVVSMVVGVVVARIVGPGVIGTVAFGMSFVFMFQFVADFGIGSAHVKLVSEGRDLGACIATFTRLKLILVGVLVLAVLGAIGVQYWILGSPFESYELLIVVFIWLAAVVIVQLSFIPASTFAGLTEQAKQDVPSLLHTIVIQVLRVVAVVLGLGAIGLSGAQLVGVTVLLIVYMNMLRKYPGGKYDARLAREYVRIGLPIAIVGFSTSLLEYLDRVMLQYSASSEQVGYYSAVVGLGGFIKTIGLAVGMLFFPLFSNAATRKDYGYINNTIKRFERFTYVFIMPCVIPIVLFSDVVVTTLLGARFAPSGPVLAVLVPGLFFLALNMPYGNLLTGMNRLRLTALLYVVNLIFFIALNALLLRHFPIEQRALGTAIAVSTSAVVLGYSFRFSVSRVTAEVSVWKNEKFFLAGVLATLAGIVLQMVLGKVESPVAASLAGIAILLSISGFFFLVRWATKDDFKMIFQVLEFKKLFDYIRSEFRKS